MDYNSVLGLKDVKISHMEETADGLKVLIQKTTSCEPCPKCNTLSSSVKNYRPHPIIAQPYKDIPVSTVVWKRCFRCSNPSCQTKFFTEQIQGILKNHTYTQSFNTFLEDMYKHMEIPTIKKRIFDNYKLSVPSSTIFYKLKDLPAESNLVPQQSLSPEFIGIDEFSYAKGHSYAVVLVNAVKRKIIDTVAGGKTTAAALAVLNSINTSNVKAASIDMWDPYRIAIRKKCPNAVIVVDRFHVIKHINDALKDIRIRISEHLDKDTDTFLYANRFILLKAFEKLSFNERIKLSALLSINSDLATAYNLKEHIRSLYINIHHRDFARLQLWRWIQWSRNSNIPEFVSIADTFASNWLLEILNYWTYRISNGITEGKINKIRLIQRKAYHYINFSRLRYQILKSEF